MKNIAEGPDLQSGMRRNSRHNDNESKIRHKWGRMAYYNIHQANKKYFLTKLRLLSEYFQQRTYWTEVFSKQKLGRTPLKTFELWRKNVHITCDARKITQTSKIIPLILSLRSFKSLQLFDRLKENFQSNKLIVVVLIYSEAIEAEQRSGLLMERKRGKLPLCYYVTDPFRCPAFIAPL